KDGSSAKVEISIFPVHIEKEDYHGSLLTCQDITQRNKKEKLNQVLCNISKAANSDITLRELFRIIHQELNHVIDAANFHIALLESEHGTVTFVYFVDEKDKLDENVNQQGLSDTPANYNINYGLSLLVNNQQILSLAEL